MVTVTLAVIVHVFSSCYLCFFCAVDASKPTQCPHTIFWMQLWWCHRTYSKVTIIIIIMGAYLKYSNMDELVDLQKWVIDSGFWLLKHGGILVYSTFSLSTRQNEDVINWLLTKYNNACIIPASYFHHSEAESISSDLQFIEKGEISGTVRFKHHINIAGDVCLLSGKGYFLTKIGKWHEREGTMVNY